ncbi:hypothetical protein [Acidiferrobacter sp.]|jgi:hypothetical protein|uniref:hypothetical protein n=1 Tax=Acidiferrobacter sp. TaxID=1872107 RepID=UPI00261139CA|nr:hypothetical protein [Acidiferrobacter sp.]
MSLTRRGLANAVLLVVAMGLAWVLWSRPKAPPAAPPPRLAPVKAAAITDITITRPGRPAIRLERIGRHWRLVQPFKARAARFRVEALTDIVDAKPHDRFAVPKGPLGAFGLAPPRAVVTLDHRRILIGRRRPFGDLRYVLTGHMICLVPAEIIHPRRLTSDSFLSTRLLGKKIHPVAFTLPHLTVTRHDGIWHAAPSPAQVSNDHINGFVDAWRYARALSVTRYHGAAAVGRVVIHYHERGSSKSQTPHTLVIDILATHPELVLLRPDQGLEYHFPEEIGKRLLAIGPGARTS